MNGEETGATRASQTLGLNRVQLSLEKPSVPIFHGNGLQQTVRWSPLKFSFHNVLICIEPCIWFMSCGSNSFPSCAVNLLYIWPLKSFTCRCVAQRLVSSLIKCLRLLFSFLFNKKIKTYLRHVSQPAASWHQWNLRRLYFPILYKVSIVLLSK